MKKVFITGGSSGIGEALVGRFSIEGYEVFFTYNTNGKKANEIEETHYLNTKGFQCDVNDYDKCALIAEHVGPVDILINNAGVAKDKTFLNMSKEEWETVLNTNLGSLYNFTSLFLPGMVQSRWGRVINISSVIGQKGGFGQSNYSASKAGMIGFTKSLALEMAYKGVTVNAIAPGFIDTPMLHGIPEQRRKYIEESMIPMQRFGNVREVADLAMYISSMGAGYITGQILGVNGGMY